MSKFRDGLRINQENLSEFKLSIEDITKLEAMLPDNDFKEFVARLSIKN